jgi:hypothetical protein
MAIAKITKVPIELMTKMYDTVDMKGAKSIAGVNFVPEPPPEPVIYTLTPNSDKGFDMAFGEPGSVMENLYTFVDEGYDNYNDVDHIAYTYAYPGWLGIPTTLDAGNYSIRFRARAVTGDGMAEKFRVDLVSGFESMYGEQGTTLHYADWNISAGIEWLDMISSWSSSVTINPFSDLSLKVWFVRTHPNAGWGYFSVVEVQFEAV